METTTSSFGAKQKQFNANGLLTFEVRENLVLKFENVLAFVLLLHFQSDIHSHVCIIRLVDVTYIKLSVISMQRISNRLNSGCRRYNNFVIVKINISEKRQIARIVPVSDFCALKFLQ